MRLLEDDLEFPSTFLLEKSISLDQALVHFGRVLPSALLSLRYLSQGVGVL